MKHLIAFLYVLGSLISGFVPAYIVDKYTERGSGGQFVNHFRPATDSQKNRVAANLAQAAFATTFGR